MISKDKDFYLWCIESAHLCRELGMHDIAEELDELAKSDVCGIDSYMTVIGHHLLKLQHASDHELSRNEKDWKKSVVNSRRGIAKILKDGPALRRQLPNLHVDAYEHALRLARIDLPRTKMPKESPWTHSQLIDHDYWPERR